MELIEKIMDPERFFRIIRNNSGKIVGYFESRQNYNHQTAFKEEVVQWVFIDEKLQGK